MENFDLFPKAKEREINARVTSECYENSKAIDEKKKEIEEKYKQLYIDGHKKIKSLKMFDWLNNISYNAYGQYVALIAIYKLIPLAIAITVVAIVAGPLVGAIIMCCTQEWENWSYFILVGLGVGCGGIGIGGIIARPVYGAILAVMGTPIFFPLFLLWKKKTYVAYNDQRRDLNGQRTKEFDELKKEKENFEIARRTEAKAELKEYEEAFEKESKERKVQYFNSDIVKEISEWLTDIFLSKIKKADRNSSINNVIVTLEYTVEASRVICLNSLIEEYNFFTHRCDNLTSAVMQSAIARAVAADVKLKLATAYEKDESGTGYGIRAEFEQSETAETVTLTYSAPNGWYERIRGW